MTDNNVKIYSQEKRCGIFDNISLCNNDESYYYNMKQFNYIDAEDNYAFIIDDDAQSELSMGSFEGEQEWSTYWKEPADMNEHFIEFFKLYRYRQELLNQLEEEDDDDDQDEECDYGQYDYEYDENGTPFKMINGVKYTTGGSIIYSDYEREDPLERNIQDPVYDGTESEIDAKTNGDLLRAQARQRIQDDPQAYKGLPRSGDDLEAFDLDDTAEDYVEQWNIQMKKVSEILEKERDIYLADGGITNEEMKYLCRNNNW